ncbi:DUF3426 domain-containing protein [Silvimonas amylolytica]|nr:DUF3426 domain-containing protein [Silvimonas amylolytica]
MSYITRCPNCRTAFKVTEPQLAAHGGKVRCGKCAFIFNARDSLEQRLPDAPTPEAEVARPETPQPAAEVKPATPASQPAPAPIAAPAPKPETAHPAPAPVFVPTPPVEVPRPVPAPAPTPVAIPVPQPAPAVVPPPPVAAPRPAPQPAPATTEVAPEPAPAVAMHAPSLPAPEPTPAPPPAETMREWLQNDYVQAIAAVAAEAEARDYDDYVATPEPAPAPAALTPAEPPAEAPAPVAPTEPLTTPEHEEPVFTVPLQTWSAEEQEREGYRPIRTAEDEALLALPQAKSKWHLAAIPLALLLVLAVLLQIGIRYRNELAVNFPWLRPPLSSLCQVAGCDLPLPRNAGLLRSDYSELIFVPDHPELIQLSASLRNLAPYDQALPSLELTLTNAQEEVVAKKVFSARDYLVANEKKRAGLTVNDELHVFLQLDAHGLGASGYSLYWFYP